MIECPNCGKEIDEKTLKIDKKKLLIVEGRDEEEFFSVMLEKLGICDIQVAGVGGKTKIKKHLKVLKDTESSFSMVTSLGIIRDADKDDNAALTSLQDALRAANLPCPRKPLVPTGTSPKVNVMILPPGFSCGALEDLCLESVKDDPAMSCVNDYFDCLDKKGVRPKNDFKKAMVRVFLSSRDNPTEAIGIAARKGCWLFENTAFNEVKKFLRSL